MYIHPCRTLHWGGLHPLTVHPARSLLDLGVAWPAVTLVAAILVATTAAIPAAADPLPLPSKYPQLFFLGDDLLSGDLDAIARFEVVSAPFWIQDDLAVSRLVQLRTLNPSVNRLAYVNPAGLSLPSRGPGHVATRLADAVADEWVVRNELGEVVTVPGFPNMPLLNLSTRCPRVNGRTWGEFIADFVTDELLLGGPWEGLYWDNMWRTASWINESTPGSIDLNGDMNPDDPDSADAWWNTGTANMLSRFRARAGSTVLAIGNGNGRQYAYLNGRVFESFPYRETWQGSMQQVADWQQYGVQPHLNLFLTKGAENDFRLMRFGFCSALIAGTFTFHAPDQHAGAYPLLYDEYLVDLGDPTGPPFEVGTVLVGEADFEFGVPPEFSTTCGSGIGQWTTDPGLVVDGIGSLVGRTTAGGGTWQLFLCSDPGQVILQPNRTYSVAFRYRVVEAPPPGGYFFVNARSDVNQSASDRNAIILLDIPAGTVGEARGEATLGPYADYEFLWGIKDGGRIVVDSIRIVEGLGGVYRRDFARGLALLNPGREAQTVEIGPGFNRIQGVVDPITNNGQPAPEVTLGPEEGLVLLRGLAPVDPPDPDPVPPVNTIAAVPNPVPMSEADYVRIEGVPAGGTVEIYTPGGRLLRRLGPGRGSRWDLRGAGGQRAGSGIYIALIRAADGRRVATLQLALHP